MLLIPAENVCSFLPSFLLLRKREARLATASLID